MKILFLHGKESGPGGKKPTYLAEHGFTVINPALPKDDFEASVRIAQAAFDEHTPDVVVGSSRGGAVAMNINIGDAGLVLLAPAWKKWGNAKTVKPQTRVIHSRHDDIVMFASSEELVASSPSTVLVEIGSDHRLSTPEPLAAMLDAVRAVASFALADNIKPERFKAPPGARFAIGSNDDGDAPVHEIWIDSSGGKVACLGPNGRPGPMGRGSVRVSEDEFWARVESGEYVEPIRPYVNSLDVVRRTKDIRAWAVEKLVFGMHLDAPADFERGLRNLKGTMSATYGVSNRDEADRIVEALLRQFGLDRHDDNRVIVTPRIESPQAFQNGYRDDKWDFQMADGIWAEVLLVTPEVLMAKNDIGDAAGEIECTVAKLKFQGALSRKLEEMRANANIATSIAYRKAWELDSLTWNGAHNKDA